MAPRPAKSGPAPVPWTVYILRCADGSLYTGVTTDLAGKKRSSTAPTVGAYE